MSKKIDFAREKNYETLLKILKNTLGVSFIDNVSEKISRLLQNLSVETSSYEETDCSENNCDILKSVKLTLEIVEWNETCRFLDDVVVDEILQTLRDLIDKRPEDSVVSDSLEVLKVLCRLCSPNSLQNLANFYLYNLHLVQYLTKEDDLRLRLRVLNCLLTSLLLLSDSDILSSFRKQCDEQNNNVIETRLFSQLILDKDDSISAQCLLTVLPQFAELFDSPTVLLTVWNAGIEVKKDPQQDLKHFSTLCFLFDLFSSKTSGEWREVFSKLLQDEKFWDAVQYGLVHALPVARRQALYLFKRSVEEMSKRELAVFSYRLNEITGSNFAEKLDEGVIKLCNGMKNFTVNNSKMFLVSSGGNNVMWWHPCLNEELNELFNDVFLVLETLEEKQVHIVKPVFQTMIRLLGPTLCPFRNGKSLHVSWILVLFQRILDHSNTSVVRWGLINLLEVDISLYQNYSLMEKIIKMIVKNLTSSSVFLNEIGTVHGALKNYFISATSVAPEVSAQFFKLFIEEICVTVWSPEPLFLVMDALQGIKSPILGPEHLQLIKQFVTSSIATHYTFLRAAVQCHLLNTLMDFSNVGSICLETLADVLSSFRRQECLQRGSATWAAMATWIEYWYSKHNAEDFIIQNVLGNVKSSVDAESVSRMICLLYDAHLFGIMKCCGEVPSCNVISVLHTILNSFHDADKRLYAPMDKLIHNLSIVTGILRENLSGQERSRLVELMLPHFGNILAFVTSRSLDLNGNDDFKTATLFAETVGLILKAQKIFMVNSEMFSSGMLAFSLDVLGVNGPVESPPMAMFLSMQYLNLIIEYVYHDSSIPKLKSLQRFFKQNVNESLPRVKGITTPELCTLWGKRNEEYLEAKWKIIGRLKGENLLTVGQKVRVEQFLTSKELGAECKNALGLGGGGLLRAVLPVVEDIMGELDDDEVEELANLCWRAVWEVRGTDSFNPSAKIFIKMLYQAENIHKETRHSLLLQVSALGKWTYYSST